MTPVLPSLTLDVSGIPRTVVWCDHCRRWHHHGGHGHRIAHCGSGSPYRASGYVLAAPVPPSRATAARVREGRP